MSNSFEFAYIYARVCGTLAHSWTGRRLADLLRKGRVSDAWRTVFGDSPPALPEAALVAAAERRAIQGSLENFRNLASHLSGKEAFFEALRRKVEYSGIKRILYAVRQGVADCPASDDPTLAPSFNLAAYPDIKKMFAKGRYSWIAEADLADLPAVENRLDRQYYTELWASLKSVRASNVGGTRGLLLLEIELENVVWALRLSYYYGMDMKSIAPLLIELPGVDVVSAALEATGFNPNKREEWTGWKFEALLGQEAGTFSLDVRSLESASAQLLYNKLRRALHMNPFSYTPLYCYFKLKEFEAVAITGLFEGISVGALEDEIVSLSPSGGGAA
jgi:hypothetical protein